MKAQEAIERMRSAGAKGALTIDRKEFRKGNFVLKDEASKTFIWRCDGEQEKLFVSI